MEADERKDDLKSLMPSKARFQRSSLEYCCYWSYKFSTKMQESNEGVNEGRWTEEEKRIFEEGYNQFGHSWKKIASMVKTRNSTQVRSHAQKYLLKKSKERKMKELIQGFKKDPKHEFFNGWFFHSVKALQFYRMLHNTVNPPNPPENQAEEPSSETTPDSNPNLA